MAGQQPSSNRIAVLSAGWVGGMRTDVDPIMLTPQQYRSGMNVLCTRGVIRSMKPLRRVCTLPTGHPQALAAWEDDDATKWLVAVVGGLVFVARDPFAYWYHLTGYEFRPDARQVFHEGGVKNAVTEYSGVVRYQAPENILFLSDGHKAVARFDGERIEAIEPGPPFFGPPIGTTVMRWSGKRMWFARGRELHASNIGEPDKITEGRQLAGGGVIAFRHELTGLLDLTGKAGLLVMTSSETFVLRSEIAERRAWQTTPDFQFTLFDEIGCVAPKSPRSHLGQATWRAGGAGEGLISLDEAQRTYTTSVLQTMDQPMKENVGRLSPDVSQTCTASFGSLFFVSGPAGDKWNRETWVRDANAGGDSPAWACAMVGILPVEWASVTTLGRKRLFCLARESAESDAVHVWEYDADGVGRGAWGDAEWPLAQFETGLFRVSGEFAARKFGFARIELADILGPVQMRVYMAPARSRVYRLLTERRIDAGAGVMVANPVAGDGEPDFLFRSQRRQGRVLHTEEIAISTDDMAAIDAPDFQGDPDGSPMKDRGFSLLVEWRGDCTILAIQLFSDSMQVTARGTALPDEPAGQQESTEQGRVCPTYVAEVPADRAPEPIDISQTSPTPN